MRGGEALYAGTCVDFGRRDQRRMASHHAANAVPLDGLWHADFPLIRRIPPPPPRYVFMGWKNWPNGKRGEERHWDR